MPAPGGRSSPPAAPAAPSGAPGCRGVAKPIWYNDWRQVAVPAPEAFAPELPVSVIVPYYAQPEELARTLAALEGQTYPRDLFEVVVVDDGSPEPLARPRETPLGVKVVRQEDRGFGLARARNTGVRAAAHDVLLFLDGDMLPEAGWLSAHACWHHAVPDAVTLGLWAHVPVDGIDAGTIRNRSGTLKELFDGREVGLDDFRWIEPHLARTNDLTSKDDDLFLPAGGGNYGIRRGFYELAGGFDEAFTQWGGEDTEFNYRAYMRGGLLVPVRDAFAWHQGPWEEGREEKDRSRKLNLAKLAHLVPHSAFRGPGLAGRTYTVPQYAVTIRGGGLPEERLLAAVEQVLSGPVHDLVVRLELSGDHAGREWLERHLGPDPRVRVAPSRPALEEFPVSPFHITLPAGRRLRADAVDRLRAALGSAVVGQSVFADGSRASIVRAWALHRAQRTPRQVSDFGDAVTIAPGKLQLPALVLPASLRKEWPRLKAELRRIDGPGAAWRFVRWLGNAVLRRARRLFGSALPRKAPASRLRTERREWARLKAGLRRIDGPGAAWRFVHWLGSGVLRRARRRFGGALLRKAPASPRREHPLGVEIVALGPRSRAVFGASGRAMQPAAGRHVDIVVADTAAEAAAAAAPAVVLAEAPAMLSVPAFDPRIDNPVGWRRDAGDGVGALGPLDRLPPGCEADRVVGRGDRAALRGLHHLEDVAAFHADAAARAGELARLAATGVLVHLADGGGGLAPYLGAELFELMTREVRGLDIDGREALGVRMRRAALREHSLASRARQAAGRVLADPPRLPLVSILLPTRRPELLERALASVRRQAYPRLELVLALHGDGFGEVAPGAAGSSAPVTVLRLDAGLPLGSVLNAAVEASRGPLLAKMDDDDLYGPEHIWDLVLAQEYSQAPLVGKGAEFVYLAASDRTVRCSMPMNECYETVQLIAGGDLLVSRYMLDRVGGWKRQRRWVDQALIHDIVRAGGRIYRTHPYGFLLVRHGRGHTWEREDAWFLERAETEKAGWRPEIAGIGGAPLPYPPPVQVSPNAVMRWQRG